MLASVAKWVEHWTEDLRKIKGVFPNVPQFFIE